MSFMLYHGSPSYFDYPDVSRGKNFRDFGVGFYLAENEIDALTIAVKDSWDGYLYTYEVNDNLFDVFSVHEFDGFDDDWLEFVYLNRMGHDTCPHMISSSDLRQVEQSMTCSTKLARTAPHSKKYELS